jgi:pyrrolidone-carboxylate peptidase
VEWAAELDVDVVLGVGVAVSRERVTVERTGGQPGRELQADVDGGVTVHLPQQAPSQVQSTVETDQLALHLNAVVGDDAGRYVCNAWLYQAVQQIDVPVGFLHIPPTGLDTERLRYAIGQMWGEQGWRPNSMT